MFDTEGFVIVPSLCGAVGCCTNLPSGWLVEQEIYDKLCKLMQKVYIYQKPLPAT